MENQQNKHESLEDYFSQARNTEPVAGLEEVEFLIKNAGVHSTNTPSFKKSFKNIFTLKYKIIMSTSIIIIAAYITSLFYPKAPVQENFALKTEKKPVTEERKSTPVLNSDLEHKTVFINNQKSGPGQEIGSKSFPYLFPESFSPALSDLSILQDMDFHSPYVPSDNHFIANGGNDPAPQKLSNGLPDIKPVELSQSELESIGFSFKNRKVEYKSYATGLGDITYKVLPNGSDVNTNKGVLFLKERDYYPVFVTQIGRDEFENVDSSLNSDKLQDGKKVEYTNYAKEFQLLPVLVKRPTSNSGPVSDYMRPLIFWFKVTPSLIENINDKELANKSVVVVNRSGMSEEAYNNLRNDTKSKIEETVNGLNPIELTATQMNRLGFKITQSGIEYHCYFKGDSNIDIQPSVNRLKKDGKPEVTLLGKGSFEFTSRPGGKTIAIDQTGKYTGKIQDFYPVFISDLDGIQSFKYRFDGIEAKDKWTDEYFLATIQKLVPVLVKQKFHGIKYGKDLIFWFNVTPSFLAALPDTISNEMGSEYKRLVQGPRKQTDTSSQQACLYFDVCQMSLEADMKLNIYPNPAKELVNVDFILPANTTASLSFTDLTGRSVRNIGQTFSGESMQHAEIQVGDLKAGIYLVNIRLSNGIVISRRVVVTGRN